jgi:hypothetical protein
VKRRRHSAASDGAQIASRGLSGPAIGDNLEIDLLLLVEAVHLDAPLADNERRFVLVLIEIAASPQRDVEKLFSAVAVHTELIGGANRTGAAPNL